MDILVLGDKRRATELVQRIPKTHQVTHSTKINDASLPRYNIIFDLNFDDDSNNLQYYSYLRNKLIVVGAVKKQLADAVCNYHGQVKCNLIGMNTLPSFIDRDLMELSIMGKESLPLVENLSQTLKWPFKVVDDRVGMITPRVIMMIINEACYTLQEGTAAIKDIDQAMKLGTNYPQGPFEWADLIGIKEVYETLDALYRDTKDERYKICPLLKTHYLKKEGFY
ncbi:hypothetical protein BH09BAC1_BH09BAC1_15640 [soil metagenome]